jgi:hypothetical protein
MVVRPGVFEGLRGLAAVAVVVGHDERAATLVGTAEAHRYETPQDIAAPAGVATDRVSGRQIAGDADNGIFKMSGSLVGDWNITVLTVAARQPSPHRQRWPRCEGGGASAIG